ncbi:hypothetical protein KJ359_009742 [Pestalotiopsis sp. 9143b]|nr:hypothetical protein KJ359_009742 [Pestalotiopsis sp. 9143b]
MAPPVLAFVKDAMTADISHVAASAAVLGVILHHSILRPLQVEEFMYTLITCLSLATGGLFSSYALSGSSIVQALIRVVLTMGGFIGGALVSMVIYRLFFHRLCKFPGPLGARVSKFYSASLAAKDVQYHKNVARMHEKYGDFIRTGPRELCIVRSSAVPLLYGPNTKCRKSTWYTQVDTDCRNCSINMTRDVDDYRRRRRAWDRGFSMKTLKAYAPRISSKVDELIAQLTKLRDTPVDATAWSGYLAFDVMGEVGFGKDFGGVSTGREHPAIRAIKDHMVVLSVVGGHLPWLLNLASRIPGATAGYAPFFRWCASEITAKQKTWTPAQEPTDIISHLIAAFASRDLSAPPSEAALHEDARVIIIAGSETTATTLASALFYLARHPAAYRKLQRLVDAAVPEDGVWSYEAVKSVTYIDDVINETLRLKPALLAGSHRLTPPEGIQVDEVHIPGDTTVFVPTQLIQTDARYWGSRAAEFVPERFSDQDCTDAPFLPFQLGLHSCPGKNLALMSLRIALSKVALNFDMSFAPGEDGANFDDAALETFTTTLPSLQLQFSKRN